MILKVKRTIYKGTKEQYTLSDKNNNIINNYDFILDNNNIIGNINYKNNNISLIVPYKNFNETSKLMTNNTEIGTISFSGDNKFISTNYWWDLNIGNRNFKLYEVGFGSKGLYLVIKENDNTIAVLSSKMIVKNFEDEYELFVKDDKDSIISIISCIYWNLYRGSSFIKDGTSGINEFNKTLTTLSKEIKAKMDFDFIKDIASNENYIIYNSNKTSKNYVVVGIILLILCITIFVLCLTGCFNKNNKNNKSNETLALEYLNNNYSNKNDNFTFVNCGYDLFSGWNDRCYFKSEKYNEVVTVYLSEENNNYSFKDDYFKLYMKDDAEKYFDDIASNYGRFEIKVRFVSTTLSTPIYTFDKYINSGKCSVEVYFFSNTKLTSDNINTILNKIVDDKIYGYFNFDVTNDSDLLSNYTLSDILNNTSELLVSEEEYHIDSNLQIIKN